MKNKLVISTAFILCGIVPVNQMLSAKTISSKDNLIVLQDEIKSYEEAKNIISSKVNKSWRSIGRRAVMNTNIDLREIDLDNLILLLREVYSDYIKSNVFSIEEFKKYLVIKRYKVFYCEECHKKLDRNICNFLCGLFNYVKYNGKDIEQVKMASKVVKKSLDSLPEEFYKEIAKVFSLIKIKYILK